MEKSHIVRLAHEPGFGCVQPDENTVLVRLHGQGAEELVTGIHRLTIVAGRPLCKKAARAACAGLSTGVRYRVGPGFAPTPP